MSLFKSKFTIPFFLTIIILGGLTSCDDNTNDIGLTAMPHADITNTSQMTFSAYSKSIKVDSLAANTSKCYLGKVTDPETGTTTTCNYAAQFFRNEEYKLPQKQFMKCDENGDVVDA